MKKVLSIVMFFQIVFFSSCDSESIGVANINQDVVDEELFKVLERISTVNNESIECIDFNYSFPLFIFDENLEYLDVILITDDLQFSDFLLNLPVNYSISLSYPIFGTLSNGDLLEINSNAELAAAVDECTQEEYQAKCIAALLSCVWEVKSLPNYPNDFEGAYFYMNINEIVQFHLDNKIYFGTWTTYYIGDDLHLNIYINTDGEIANTWNYDWNIASFLDYSIELETADNRTLIEKTCSINCAIGAYQECELETDSGIAEFAFKDYAFCIQVPGNHDLASPIVYSFYETEEDALAGINPVSTTQYSNNVNPQTIYVRIEYIESGEVIGLTEIIIEAITC